MTGNTLRHDGRIARRSVLATLGLGAVALSGCSSEPSTDPKNNSTNDTDSNLGSGESDVFSDVGMEDETLEVEIADDVSVEFINLVDPNDELYDQQRLESGVTTTSFEILGRSDDFVTGEYELVALDDDEAVDTTTVTLEADCRITDVFWAAENPDMEWDKDVPNWEEYAAVVIENTGTIPSLLTELEWAGAPVARLQSQESQSYYHETRLQPGKTTVYSAGSVYATDDAVHSLDCRDLETEPMTVTAVVQIGPDPSYTQQIEYSGDQSCDLSIVETSSDEPTADGGES